MDKRLIDTIGNSYFKKSFQEKESKEVKYRKGKVAIGYLKYQIGGNNQTQLTDSIFYLEFTDAVRWLFLGMPNSGKTWLLRVIADRLNKVKKKDGNPFYHIIFPSDIKNEFYTSRFPLQKQYQKFLMKDEKPEGMKIITFRPTFFKSVEEKLPVLDRAIKRYTKHKHLNYWYSINLSKMSQKDFIMLLNPKRLSEIHKTMAELLHNRIKKIKDFKQEDINDAIDSLPETFPSNAKQSLKDKFLPLIESNISETKYYRNLISLLRQGNQISFNMRFFEKFTSPYPETLLNVVLGEIALARKTKQLNPVFILLDESARFLPKDRNPSCKLTILESSQIDRREGISYLFVAQSLDNIAPQVISDSSLYFIPQNIDAKTLGHLISLFGITATPQAGRIMANRIKKRAKEHEWFVINKEKKIISIIKPFAPLSHQLDSEMT